MHCAGEDEDHYVKSERRLYELKWERHNLILVGRFQTFHPATCLENDTPHGKSAVEIWTPEQFIRESYK